MILLIDGFCCKIVPPDVCIRSLCLIHAGKTIKRPSDKASNTFFVLFKSGVTRFLNCTIDHHTEVSCKETT
uniref:Uncharacterized protein n=1 Tax=Romanomermis culicivorax TaxID=13658 RepID=A0A915KBQ1_ROMCU